LFSDLPVAWVVHENGLIRDFNRAAGELFAIDDPAAGVGRDLLDFVHPDSTSSVQERLRVLYESGRPVRAVEERMVRADGGDLWVETIASLTVVDSRPAVQVLCWDITERVLEQERLAHAAMHDGLTGLPNRAMLEKQWSTLQTCWESPDRPPAVLFCDLNGFKAINDRYGHAVGDVTLRAVAARLSGALRSQDVLGRYGGDEFVVLVEGDTLELAHQLTDRLTAALEQPIHVEDTVLQVGISVGLAFPVTDEEPLEALLERADEAMYDHKRSSRRDSSPG
jgi:diguanylate cyclase (GGDEF)-like protein/PAS domain S-box-containing protein